MKEIEIKNIVFFWHDEQDVVDCSILLIIDKKPFDIVICKIDDDDWDWKKGDHPGTKAYINMKDKVMWKEILNLADVDFKTFERIIIDSVLDFFKKGFKVKV